MNGVEKGGREGVVCCTIRVIDCAGDVFPVQQLRVVHDCTRDIGPHGVGVWFSGGGIT